MSAHTLPTQADSLWMIKCRGFDHPLFGDVLQLEKNFKATLVKQYRDIIVSCYLEVSLRNAHNLSSPLGVLARDIPQHALIVIRQLLRDADSRGVSLVPLWREFNTIENHLCAKTKALKDVLDAHLPRGIPDTFKPFPTNVGIYCPPVMARFESALNGLYYQPESRDTLYEDIRGKYEDSVYESIGSWPPAAQAKFLNDPELRQRLKWLKYSEDSAASITTEHQSLSSISDAVRRESTTGITASERSRKDDAIPTHSTCPTKVQSRYLPEDIQSLIEDYYSFMAP